MKPLLKGFTSNSDLGYGRISPCRCYATVSDGPKKASASSDGPAWPSSPHPTPYEIFDLPKATPYSKAKFYELVKIYHPDKHRHTHNHPLPHKVRLERYRLVVSANQILSDPVKRRAYDLYGAGWGGNRTMENLYRTADRSWREKPGNASMNATWEDWERWYRERNGDKKEDQQPVYMSNRLFAGVLCIFVVIGSLGQARRASSNTMNLVETREQHHAAINQDMRRRQSEQVNLSRHERVENFLRQRDG
ncbi:J domain-containing protein 1 [Parahypoxylon ruwenzoriense]